MKQELNDIYHLLNMPQWEILQDHLADVSNMAIITIDYKGVPVTHHSRCRSFCQSVRNDPFLCKLCQTCDSRGGLEAVRARKPYIYLCHFDIVDLAVPITWGGNYIGAIMAGQIRLSDPADTDSLEKVLSSQKNQAARQHLREHFQDYLEIPEMSLSQINTFAQMLFSLYNYIAESTVSAPSPGRSRDGAARERPGEGAESYSLHRRKPHMGSAVLKPALDLLSDGVYDRSQKEMADLCHLSPSYFSRLFIQETRLNYSQYVTQEKLSQAKRMLEQTALSVARISDDLLFSSPCYFAKVFKKLEGITPNAYRKYYRDADHIMNGAAPPSGEEV